MSQPLDSNLTPDSYLEFERRSQIRHEYIDGELFAMTGASLQHNQVVVNFSREISVQLKEKQSFIYTNDMRVRVPAMSRYFYPDAVCLCGTPLFEDREQDTLTNPNLIAEVLSKSTQAYDRGEKFEDYRRIPAMNEYVLIAQDRPHVEQFLRQSNGRWLFMETNGIEKTIELPSISCPLSLTELYDKVEFEAEG